MKSLTEIIGFIIVFGLISGSTTLPTIAINREWNIKLEPLAWLKNKATKLFQDYERCTEIKSHVNLTTSACTLKYSACDPKQTDNYNQILHFYYCSLNHSKSIFTFCNIGTTITAITNQMKTTYSHLGNTNHQNCRKCLDIHHSSDWAKQIYFWKVFKEYVTCMNQAYQSLEKSLQG